MSTIFISWSGDRSRRVAEALRDWLPYVIDCPDLWMSSHDIPDGARWFQEVSSRLEECNVGIIVLTAENLASPWVTFEAGALAKNILDGRVIPLLVGIEASHITGPLAQFQCVDSDRDGILGLIRTINTLAPTPAPESIFEKRLSRFWPDLRKVLQEVASDAGDVRPPLTMAQLQQQLQETTDILKQLVGKWNPLSAVPQPVTNAQAHEFLRYEGAWIDKEANTNVYVRQVGERMYAPYCFGGNHHLTGVLYGWQQTGQYWFARLQWLKNSEIHGFVFVTPASDDELTGAWWYDEDAEEHIAAIAQEGIQSRHDGHTIRLIRLRDASVPDWASEYLERLERESPFENALKIDA